jgi:hypothetical protein
MHAMTCPAAPATGGALNELVTGVAITARGEGFLGWRPLAATAGVR